MTTNVHIDEHMGRDGHISELALESYLQGELAPDVVAHMEAHLEACEVCRERVERARAINAQFAAGDFALPPSLRSQAPVVSLEAARSSGIKRLGPWLAAAAAIALVALPFLRPEAPTEVPPTQTDRVKGGPMSLEVFVHDGASFEPLASMGEVHPGQQLEFRVTTVKAGYLMVIGRDETGSVYEVYPGSGGQARSHPPMPQGTQLDRGLKLDDVLGQERLSALLCPAPFTFSQAPTILETRSVPGAQGACTTRAFVVLKTKKSPSQPE